jgi:hypothetical protein
MAGGLFVFVRTAPPGGCALAITAGQYRPPMAHCPLSRRSGGPFFYTVTLYLLRGYFTQQQLYFFCFKILLNLHFLLICDYIPYIKLYIRRIICSVQNVEKK